jgi:UDP-glucuronate 4-epimerase
VSRARAVVTGGAGFIGAHVCQALLDHGWEVVGFDNFDPFYDRRLKERGVARLVSRPGFRLVEADIRQPGAVEHACRGAEVCIHLAARAGVRPSLANPALYASVNVDGTATVLGACRAAGVRRIVFGSSSSVYGDGTPLPFREDAPAGRPASPYAATKRAGELMCRTYSRRHGLRIAMLRFFTVYGPRQRPDLAIHRFTRLLATGRSVRQFGDGSSERDYTHVDDIVQGVLGAVRWTAAAGPACDAFNLGEASAVRLDRLIALIAAALGTTPRVDIRPPQPGDVRRTCADVGRARRELGYDPKTPIEIGIPQFVSWYRAYGHESLAAS